MKALLEDAGIRLTENGFSAAETAAYAKGLALVREQLETAEAAVLFDENGENTLSEYARMLSLDGRRYDRAALTAMIRERMRECFSPLSGEAFDEGFLRVGSGSVSADGNTLVFDGVQATDLAALGSFIAGYVPIVTGVRCNGSGMTFDAWDGTGLCFLEYDAMKLPFDILDTLRSDTFEQHA